MNGLPLGKTSKYMKANLLAEVGGKRYKVGWFMFASDGGFHAQFHYAAPVTAIGQEVLSDGVLRPVTEVDLSQVPEVHRHDVHLSLHPSGRLHVRSGENPCLMAADVGLWLPLTKPRLLGYLFSPPIRELAAQTASKFQDRVLAVSDLDSGLRATITLLPKKPIWPARKVLMGVCPKCNVGIEIDAVKPATPGIHLMTTLLDH